MKDAPGGGYILTLFDPENIPVNLMFDQSPAKPNGYPEKLIINHENDKPRVLKFQRFDPGPAAVHKVFKSSPKSIYLSLIFYVAGSLWVMCPKVPGNGRLLHHQLQHRPYRLSLRRKGRRETKRRYVRSH